MPKQNHLLSYVSQAGLLLMLFVATGFTFTKTNTFYTTDGSQIDVQAAIYNANPGDVVHIPAGHFIWGTNGTFVHINTPITLQGAGTNLTYIEGADNAGMYGNAVIRISSSAIVRDFAFNGLGWKTTAFSAGNVNGWRISNILYNGNLYTAYFAYCGSYGLIDNCTINGAAGTAELIFTRGPLNSWQTPQSMGTTNAVYVENCVFNGPGYVCDANSNSRFVVRFCTITGKMKIDGHGKASNIPARGVRHMEVYENRWTNPQRYWTAIELRGGSGMVFDNLCDGNGIYTWFYLTEYGSTAQWPNFGSKYQTPVNYPVDDQIGVGIDPKVAASEPMYLWNNTSANNTDWPLTWKNVPAAAISYYTNQVNDPLAKYTVQDIIKADRDYFKGTNGVMFTGAGGVGRGTKAQMNAIIPTKTGVGFWVTDEADWNTKSPGPDGQLYVWSGSAWQLKYTPYTYPFFRQKPFPPSNLHKN